MENKHLLEWLSKAKPPLYPNAHDRSSNDAEAGNKMEIEQAAHNLLILNNMLSDHQLGASKGNEINNEKWHYVL